MMPGFPDFSYPFVAVDFKSGFLTQSATFTILPGTTITFLGGFAFGPLHDNFRSQHDFLDIFFTMEWPIYCKRMLTR